MAVFAPLREAGCFPLEPPLANYPGRRQNGGMKPWRIARKDVLGLKFACPDCGQHIDAGREMFGELIECPTCGKQMQVPDLKNAPGDFPSKKPPKPSKIIP